MTEVCNSAIRSIPSAGSRPYNPAYLHPDDLAELGVEAGDAVEIRSARSSITAIAQPAADLLRGTISCAHGWGSAPEHDGGRREAGSNVGRLIATDADADPWSGIPVMSAIPVRVTKIL
jgi:anaerobic selenocysteine-containing dehydrogenase